MYNGMYYNPAFAGKQDGFRFSILNRSQWLNYSTSSGQSGAPTNQLITAQGRLKDKGLGYGITIVNDQIGPTGNLEINLQVFLTDLLVMIENRFYTEKLSKFIIRLSK
jgi:hypothetical protein